MQTTKKLYRWVIVSVTTVVLLGAWGIFTLNQAQAPPAATPASQIVSPARDYISFTATSDGTVLAQLKDINRTVITKKTKLGIYVDSINGLEGGTDGKYWSYYVNGKMGSVGANTYIPRKGEVIEWKFRS